MKNPDCICEHKGNRRVPSIFCPAIHPIDYFKGLRDFPNRPDNYTATYVYMPDGSKVEIQDGRNDSRP